MSDSAPRKRPRINRACASCRRRKIKCDGTHPCKACFTNEIICSYDDEERRRNGPEYIQALEKKIEELETLLGHPLMPNEQSSRHNSNYSSRPNSAFNSNESSIRLPSYQQAQLQRDFAEDDVLETMVPSDRASTPHASNKRHWGHFAGLSLLQRMRKLCSRVAGLHQASQEGDSIENDFVQAFDSAAPPEPSVTSWEEFAMLPSRDRLMECINVTIEQACCLLNFIDRRALDDTVNRIYDIDALEYTAEDRKSLSLIFAILALGRRFEDDITERESNRLNKNVSKGLRYFRASRSMLEVANCHDIQSLQTVLCLVIYLQASSMLSTSYSYICAGVAASLRMGLHSSEVLEDMPQNQQQIHKCVFSVLNMMDTYVTTALGLPRTLRDVDSDAVIPVTETPSELGSSDLLDDSNVSLIATNAHAKLIHIMARAVDSNHPVTKPICQKNGFYGVEYRKIVEVEEELSAWYDSLSSSSVLSLDSDSYPERLRPQLLLRLAYAHVQMVLYRPFLHHAARSLRPYRNIRYRAYACGSACVKAAMQVVWLAEALEKHGLFNEANWFVALSISFAATILMLFVLSNEGDETIKLEADAAERLKNLLSRHSHRSLSARRSFAFLQELSEANTSGQHYYSELSSHTADPFLTPTDVKSFRAAEGLETDVTMDADTGVEQEHTLQAMSYPRMHPYLDEIPDI